MKLEMLLENSGWKTQQAECARLAKKWVKSGLLEGLNAETDKHNMSLMLENQAKYLVNESNLTNNGGATFTVGQGEQWAGIALPLVRKIFGQIAAKEFVSVQPMNMPSGLVFYLDFQYGTTKSPVTQGDSLYGITSASADADGGLYGPGRWGYSINQFSSSLTGTSGSVTYADINFDATYSASLSSLKKITIDASAISTSLDNNGVRVFEISSGSVTSATTLNNFTTYNPVNGQLTFINNGVALNTSGTYILYYNKKTVDNARGDFEDANAYAVPNAQSNTTISIPEIDIKLRSESITAKTRKLKAQWTPEFSQDLNAYQSLDAEAELTSILSEYISLEIDLEILDMLIQNAPNVEYWSAKVGNQINAGATGFDSNTSGVYYTQMSWFQTLGIKMQKISNIIHQKTLRGGANFIVISPAVSTVIESIPGFAADTDGAADNMKYAFGVQKVGMLNSRYKVYKNPYMIENVILMGLRGSQFLETGAVYAPYIPLIMTPLVYDPTTFTPRKGIMTRYAKKMVRPEFYGLIKVADLNIV